jgi:hypothetical protein
MRAYLLALVSPVCQMNHQVSIWNDNRTGTEGTSAGENATGGHLATSILAV